VRGIVIGTGPSLTQEAIELINASSLPKFGCNNTYQVCELTALLACNPEWWDYYWEDVRKGEFTKWTWDKPTSEKYGIAYIKGEWGDSLSTDPEVIHYGHSSGYQLLNLAYHFGVREFVLCGYDLRYPRNYDRNARRPGGDRHFFGEYAPELEHWPMVGPSGEMTGLLDCYRTIDAKELGIRIINCSPGSALDFFEMGKLENEL